MDNYKLNRVTSRDFQRHQTMLNLVAPGIPFQKLRQLQLFRNLMGFHQATRLHDLPTKLQMRRFSRELREQLNVKHLSKADPEIRLAIESFIDPTRISPDSLEALVQLCQQLKHHVLSEDSSQPEANSMLVVKVVEQQAQINLMMDNRELQMLSSLLSLWLQQKSPDPQASMN